MKRKTFFSSPRPIFAVAEQYAKPITLAALVVLAGLSQYLGLTTYYAAEAFGLDLGWFLGLQEQLQQGRLLGRDIYFTYGPLAQLITSLGVLLRGDPSPVAGYATNMFIFHFLALILLAGAILLLREVHASVAALLFLVCFLLDWIIFARTQMLLFSTVVLARALTASPNARRLLAGVAGALWFAGQMLATDTGIYSLATAVLFLTLMAGLTLSPFRRLFTGATLLPARIYLETLGIGLTVFIALNLAVEAYFQLTQPIYASWDNLRYNFAIAQGYNRTMGVPWGLGASTEHITVMTITLFGLFVFNAIGVVGAARSSASVDTIHAFFGLFIAGSILMKGAITRSDLGHILGSFGIHVILLILIISNSAIYYMRIIGIVLLVLLVAVWSPKNISGIDRILRLASGQMTLKDKAQEVWATSADIAGLAPSELRDGLGKDKQIVNFPWANYLAMALDMPTFAPVLQTYAAHDEQLQRMYVNRLQAVRSQVEVIYAIDGVSRFAGGVDGVQNVSRVPIIAEYLIEHFRLKHSRVFGDGLYVLTPREQPIELQRSNLPFTSIRNDDILSVQIDGAATCTFAELELIIDYPITAIAGRPNALVATVSHNSAPVLSTNLVAIEDGRPFTTLVYLGQPYAYSQVFADHSYPDTFGTFDAVMLAPAPVSLFTVNPSRLEVVGLRCVTVPSTGRVESPDTHTLAPGQTLNLWEHAWVPSGGTGPLRRIDNGLFIHSGHRIELGPYVAPPGMCLTATASFAPEAQGKPEADGAEFVATILTQTEVQPTSVAVAIEPDETAPIRLAAPAGTPFTIRLETRPRGNSAWDWAIWRTPRLAPCSREQ